MSPVFAEEPATHTASESAEINPPESTVTDPDALLPIARSLPVEQPVEQPADLPAEVRPTLAATAGPTEADFQNARRIQAELAAYIETTAAALEKSRERLAETEAAINELAGRLEGATPGTKSADEIHEVIVERLTRARREIRTALHEVGRPSRAPSIAEIENVSGRRSGLPDDEWRQLVDAVTRLRKEAREIEERLRWTNVAVAGETFHQLSSLRTISFGKISLEKRDLIFGTRREGLEQLTGELRHLVVAGRYYVVVRSREIRLAPAMNYFALGEIIITVLRLALVLAVALFVRTRWRDWLHEARGPLFRWFRTLNARRRLERVLSLFEIAFPWLIFFLTLGLAEWALGTNLLTFEIALALSLLYYYGGYRLAIDLIAAGIFRLSTRYELAISDERKRLVRASVMLFCRVVFGLAVLNLVSSRLLGGGYLSQVASRFAVLVVAITLLVLMLRWRRELADAFLSKHPSGPIADLVRRTRDTWLGVFVAPASLLWILGRAGAVLARDFAMGFEQTQRALAFLFRRRIEKEAERRGYAVGELETLPDRCLEAFSEDAIDRGPGLIDNFPGLEDLLSDLSAWRECGEGRSFLLTGQRGVGKTTWLRQIRRDDVGIDHVWQGVRVTSREAFIPLMADRLGCPDPTFDGLVRHLVEGEPRIVLLDDAQHLFLATVNGYDAWSALVELINRTRRQVFWVAAMSAYAFNHLRAVRSDWSVFSRHQHIDTWSEERIRELLRARVKASGLHYNYSSLVLERLEGVRTRDHLIESAEGYARLLWDYADGNPRVAIHFFLRSLDPDSENRVSVRLFRAPDVARIEAMGEIALFLLSCMVTHESISELHIGETTRYPGEICRIHLDRFLDEGMAQEDDGLYRITTHWHRAVVRTLRRRNILSVGGTA
jgi:hypothetical protein